MKGAEGANITMIDILGSEKPLRRTKAGPREDASKRTTNYG